MAPVAGARLRWSPREESESVHWQSFDRELGARFSAHMRLCLTLGTGSHASSAPRLQSASMMRLRPWYGVIPHRLRLFGEVPLTLKMTLLTDYADAQRFEIRGEEGIIQVTRCSDRMLDEPALTLYRDGEVWAFHNLDPSGARASHRPQATSLTSLQEGKRKRRSVR
jgi:hypothetical protein